jgi:hypothetical protein
MADHLTSITIHDLEKLKAPRNSYLDLLVFNEEEVARAVQNSQPIAKVLFTRLEPKTKVFEGSQNTVYSSANYAELAIAEKPLYDLGSIERVMCLAIGRYAHNHFRPFLSDANTDMDPYVSREHGLIFLNEHKQIAYHDIGTFKKGSTNGTKLNDTSVLQNEITIWNEADYFGLGEVVSVMTDSGPKVESRFKLRYRLA